MYRHYGELVGFFMTAHSLYRTNFCVKKAFSIEGVLYIDMLYYVK